MCSTIVTAALALALAYGITAVAAMAAPALASVDGSLHAQCGTVGDYCWVGGIERPPCCDGLFCFSDSGIPSGVSDVFCMMLAIWGDSPDIVFSP